MMYDAIQVFAQQFAFEPKIENDRPEYRKFRKFIITGMGGSALAAGLLPALKSGLDILVHKDYGLPALPPESLAERLIIASSYSGNTEETLSAFEEASRQKLPLVAICVAGKLLDLAKKHGIPYVVLPDTGVQPRAALGLSVRGILKLMGLEEELSVSGELATLLSPSAIESQGKALAEKIRGHVPVVYASARYAGVAYIWKIKLNETGKIPAFYNFFPELNHNEMNGMDAKDASRHLSERFHFLFLKSDDDHPKNLRRMEVTEKLYRDRGFPVEVLEFRGQNPFHKVFSSLLLADWTAYHNAVGYGLEPTEVPMVEEFKQLIA